METPVKRRLSNVEILEIIKSDPETSLLEPEIINGKMYLPVDEIKLFMIARSVNYFEVGRYRTRINYISKKDKTPRGRKFGKREYSPFLIKYDMQKKGMHVSKLNKTIENPDKSGF
jgi:hypothetical protein